VCERSPHPPAESETAGDGFFFRRIVESDAAGQDAKGGIRVFELFQIVWDLIMIRDNVRKGSAHDAQELISIGFVVLMYGIGVPAAVLYDKHPSMRQFLLLRW